MTNQRATASDDLYKETRAARPDEVNYALKQNMGQGYERKTVTVSALGTTFDVVYGEWVGVGQSSEDSPVVLCIHGAPATDGAFRPIGSLIAAQGYRLLAPNAPGHGYTERDKEKRYDFSTPHKVEILKGFLRAMNVERVAMVMGHSLGSHIAAHFVNDPENIKKVSSVCWMGGTGVTPHKMHQLTTRVPYLAYLTYILTYLPIMGPFFQYFMSKYVYMLGFRGRTRESQCVCIYEASVMDFKQYEKDLNGIAERDLPTLVFYAVDDPVVEVEVIQGAIDALQIPEKDVKGYDENCEADVEYTDSTLRRVVRVAKGTHRIQFTNPDITAKEVVSLLGALKSNL